jgi:osmoprotectant transport system ATP-binding protein
MIRLESVSKRFPDGQVAVGDLTLEVVAGETCVLVGPSGCGKTTTLKMINRLVEPTSGRILLNGEDVTHVDPVSLRLKMGYVIQQVGLFPHLSVADNVATVPRLLGWDRARTRRRVDELLALVGLPPAAYRARYPSQLSGGQRQRVGVARALGADPPVLLMDEPFGAIDTITRERLQNEFLRIQDEMRKTVVFVTHDIDEAIKLGDRIAILGVGGKLQQYDTPAAILAHPASDLVADLLGRDRGFKRLAVTPLESAMLEHPPIVSPESSLAEARRQMDAVGAHWALVAAPADGRYGELMRADTDGDGTVAARARWVDARVSRDATLRDALSEMLLHDAGWVAVVDGERLAGVLTPTSLQSAMRSSLRVSAEGSPAR